MSKFKISDRFGGVILRVGFLVLFIFALYWCWIGKVQLCVLRLFTGLPCPGCGLTRAAAALLRGDLSASLHYHPLLGLVLFAFLTLILRNKCFFNKLHQSRYFYISIIICLCLLYIIRMVLFFPNGPEPMTYDKASLLGKILTVLNVF